MLTASDADKARAAAAFKANRGTLAREIVDAAGIDLANAVNKLMFETDKDYDTCARRLIDTTPWYGLAHAAIAANPEQSLRALGIEVEAA